MGRKVGNKKPKTDKQSRVICRTALMLKPYSELMEISKREDRSIAYLLRQGAEEVIKIHRK